MRAARRLLSGAGFAVVRGPKVLRVPFVASGPADSWVSIGGDVDGGISDTAFSPGFLNSDSPGASLIHGSFFEQLENGGYVDSSPGTPENGGSVVILQFTVSAGAWFTFEGTVDWQSSPGRPELERLHAGSGASGRRVRDSVPRRPRSSPHLIAGHVAFCSVSRLVDPRLLSRVLSREEVFLCPGNATTRRRPATPRSRRPQTGGRFPEI